MVTRGEIYWADTGPASGRRPVVVVTRASALRFLGSITVAHITTTIRNNDSVVPVGSQEGLPRPSIVNCDNLLTIPRASLDAQPVGRLVGRKISELNEALRYALGIPG
ncbi:MAG: type II toxin-antitoxin system PemK/MazF family toxin [Actinomycetota bacterium]